MNYLALFFKVIGLVACVMTWHKAAEMEENGPSPFIWAGIAAAICLVTWLLLGWGWPGIIAAQLGMGLAIGLIRTAIHLRKLPPVR